MNTIQIPITPAQLQAIADTIFAAMKKVTDRPVVATEIDNVQSYLTTKIGDVVIEINDPS